MLTTTARKWPDRPAVRSGGGSHGGNDDIRTYADVDDGAARIAHTLLGGRLAPGDRVGLMLPNTPEFADAYYGVLRAGGVVVPLDPGLSLGQVGCRLADSGASRLLTADPAPGTLRAAESLHVPVLDVRASAATLGAGAPVMHVAQRRGDDIAVLLYGASSNSHGVALTHENLRRNAPSRSWSISRLLQAG
ncbi:AMP-binding protein [Streptomycetaceae bacterium NBC_01309]